MEILPPALDQQTGFVLFLCILPLVAGGILGGFPRAWFGMEKYGKWKFEYGEKQKGGESVITVVNSWTSLSYWYVGVYAVKGGMERGWREVQNCGDIAPLWQFCIAGR